MQTEKPKIVSPRQHFKNQFSEIGRKLVVGGKMFWDDYEAIDAWGDPKTMLSKERRMRDFLKASDPLCNCTECKEAKDYVAMCEKINGRK